MDMNIVVSTSHKEQAAEKNEETLPRKNEAQRAAWQALWQRLLNGMAEEQSLREQAAGDKDQD